MQLVLDTREPTGLRCLISEAINDTYKSVTIIEAALQTGDALVQAKYNAYLVERKTTDDLVASLSDGRLKAQVNRLCKVDKTLTPLIIVHGALPRIDRYGNLYTNGRGKTKMNYWSLQMAVMSIQLAGVPVWWIGGSDQLDKTNLYPDALVKLVGYGNKKQHTFIEGIR